MRQVPAKKLLETQTQIFRFEEPSIADFAIDGKLLKDNPRRLLEAGNFPKKPLLIGTVPYEVRFTQYLRKDGVLDEKELLEICELIGFGVYEHPYAFVEKCFEFYMDNDTSDFIVDDYIIHVPTANLAAHHATEHPVYLYSYSYSGLGPGFTNYIPGAFSPIHSEDFAYIFGVHRTSNFTEKDLQIERIFTGMLTDFVNFGEPKGDDWTRLNPEIMNYFDIDFGEKLEMPGMKYEFYKRQREFWNVISRE
uniref:COesterase domain-containing protein n=1 Tax=Caenorhabditis tropicalis TaxID=1561998 RepID=A0A1I7U4Q0_9PELO